MAHDKSKGNGKNRGATPDTAQREEDIDTILRELNIIPHQSTRSIAAHAGGMIEDRPALAISLKHLKVEEELRRMFGSAATESATRDGGAEAMAGYSRRIRRLAARGRLVRHTLKPGIIIAPRDTWPRPDGCSVTLEPTTRKPTSHQGGLAHRGVEFKMSSSPAYDIAQNQFEEFQATYDPRVVTAFLQAHPYHLDASLTMADVYRSMGENATADELIERCLYGIECGWPPSFSAALSAGQARISFDPETNGPLFSVLFRYMQALGRRGLHRTALEVCKLLLQLDPDDPMGALATLDYFAVRSGQYEFLHRLVDGTASDVDPAVALLPNMVFSQALAQWYEESQRNAGKASRSKDDSYNKNETRARETTSSETLSSRDALVKAVLLHPLAVVRLQTRLQDQYGVAKDGAWMAALAQPLLACASDGDNPGLSHLIDIFVERQATLWKAGPVQTWFLAGVQTACEAAIDGRSLPDGSTAADWAQVRAQAFPPSDTNGYAHLRVHEFSETVARLPPEEIHGWGGAHQHVGVLPDGVLEEEIRGLVAAEVGRMHAVGGAPGREGGEAAGAEALHDMHPLVALVRSLLPGWGIEGEQPEYGRRDEEDDEEERE